MLKKYEKLIEELETKGTGSMRCFGNSMTPIITSGSLLTFEKKSEYEVEDIVFCKCRSRIIEAHKIIQKDKKRGYLIANNKGGINGWTRKIYGHVTKIIVC